MHNGSLILIHGFPTSSLDYRQFFDDTKTDKHSRVKKDQLKNTYILSFDFPGFGHSDKPTENYFYGIQEHADTLIEVLRQKVKPRTDIKSCKFIAHDMGDTVMTEILARLDRKVLPGFMSENNFIEEIIFTNGGMYYQHISKRLSQIILSNNFFGKFFEKFFKVFLPKEILLEIQEKQLKTIFAKKFLAENSKLLTAEKYIHDLAYLNALNTNNFRPIASKLIQYLNDRGIYEYRWHNALKNLSNVSSPKIRLLWGDDDAVAPIRIAQEIQKLNQDNIKLTYLKDTGHFWMVEKDFDEYARYIF